MIFLIGLITSYQDFKEGKIKNKWIILGLVWALGIYLLLLIWAISAPYLAQIYSKEFTFILPSYILKVFINSLIALLGGYLLWYFNLWSAGDAKLFALFTFLLPLRFYSKSYLPYFPSFVLLINTFIPVLIFLICQNLFCFLKKALAFREIQPAMREKILKLKTLFKKNYLNYLKVGLGFLLLFMFFRLIKFELDNRFGQVGWWQTTVLLLIIILRKSLSQFLKKSWLLILILLGIIFYLVASYFFSTQAVLPKFFLSIKSSILFVFIFIIVSALLSYVPEGQKKHLPFAVWMLLGVIITMILKGSIISFLINLFQ